MSLIKQHYQTPIKYGDEVHMANVFLTAIKPSGDDHTEVNIRIMLDEQARLDSDAQGIPESLQFEKEVRPSHIQQDILYAVTPHLVDNTHGKYPTGSTLHKDQCDILIPNAQLDKLESVMTQSDIAGMRFTLKERGIVHTDSWADNVRKEPTNPVKEIRSNISAEALNRTQRVLTELLDGLGDKLDKTSKTALLNALITDHMDTTEYLLNECEAAAEKEKEVAPRQHSA